MIENYENWKIGKYRCFSSSEELTFKIVEIILDRGTFENSWNYSSDKQKEEILIKILAEAKFQMNEN